MPRRKRDFRWVKWILFLVLIVAAVVTVVLIVRSFDDKNKTNNNLQTTEIDDVKDGEEGGDTSNSEEKAEQSEKAPQYDGESPNKSETLTGLISYADVINGELVIRVNIDQFLQSGNCNLVISRNGVTYYTQSAPIQESVTTSTCDGYNIAVSNLSDGDFQIEIDLKSGDKGGKITGRVMI